MKLHNLFTTLFLFMGSCGKQSDLLPPPPASLVIVNAVVDPVFHPLVTSFGGTDPITWYKDAFRLSYNAYSSLCQFSCPAGQQRLAFYPYPDTLNPKKPLLSLNLPLLSNRIYSLFLAGTVDAPDTVFTEDHIPFHPISDSVTGLRFVNLSPGSNPITVNIKGMDNGSEVDNLSYKAITAFKNYPANSLISTYIFEFRDKASGKLLATYTASGINNYYSTNVRSSVINKWLFKNSTLVFLGLPEYTGTNAQTVLLVNNF